MYNAGVQRRECNLELVLEQTLLVCSDVFADAFDSQLMGCERRAC